MDFVRPYRVVTTDSHILLISSTPFPPGRCSITPPRHPGPVVDLPAVQPPPTPRSARCLAASNHSTHPLRRRQHSAKASPQRPV